MGHLFHLERFAITKLYNSTPEEVARYDLAEMNLISAFGLPGAEHIDMGAMLALLDFWAKQVAAYTVKHMVAYRAHAAEFGSLARFRITAMIQCLNEEIGIRYNPARITDPDNFDDPEDSFIHGLLGPRRMGTCASLPVLLTALGRRLGYPLKLVLVPTHCLCRWDSPQERFNIEYHAKGLNSQPDEHYYEWPMQWTPDMNPQERERPTYLISLTPQQDLAVCALNRAHQLSHVGRHREALWAMQVADRFWPSHVNGVWVIHLLTKAMYPEENWPELPCEETTGQAVRDRLARDKLAFPVPV